MKIIKTWEEKPEIVSAEWLIDSVNRGVLLDTASYTHLNLNPPPKRSQSCSTNPESASKNAVKKAERTEDYVNLELSLGDEFDTEMGNESMTPRSNVTKHDMGPPCFDIATPACSNDMEVDKADESVILSSQNPNGIFSGKILGVNNFVLIPITSNYLLF